jgi:hypothetical protein
MAVILFFLPLPQQVVAAVVVALQIQRLEPLVVRVAVRLELLVALLLERVRLVKEIMVELAAVAVAALLLVAAAGLVQLVETQP